jgi:serine/threonine protein phosphatase PrpC
VNTIFRFALAQITGGRENQEDACVIRSGLSPALQASEEDIQSGETKGTLTGVLCDGMGGHAGGEVASGIAAKLFIASVTSRSTNDRPVGNALHQACEEVNQAIHRKMIEDSSIRGMGTTLVGIHCANDRMNWISIGDSHLLLLRNSTLTKLNQDHSMKPVIEQMVEQGIISREEALEHPQRNALRSVLAGGEIELVDEGIPGFSLQRGDVVLLASDGIDVIPQRILANNLKQGLFSSPASSVVQLLKSARQFGGSSLDNTTVAVISVR